MFAFVDGPLSGEIRCRQSYDEPCLFTTHWPALFRGSSSSSFIDKWKNYDRPKTFLSAEDTETFPNQKKKKNGRIVGRSSLGRYLQKNVNFRLKMNKFFALNQWNEWIGFSFRNVSADFIQIQLLAWKHWLKDLYLAKYSLLKRRTPM